MNLRKVRLLLLAYCLFDVFIGGYNGGMFPLQPLAGAQISPIQGAGYQHRLGNIYYSWGYQTYQATVLNTISSGSGTLIVVGMPAGAGGVALSDGTVLPLTTVFNTNTPITVNDANAETVTPSAVSVGPCPAGFLGVGSSATCANVTATFSNAHGASAPVVSGDQGIFEAITDAGNNGGGLVYWTADTGIVTLNTGGLTTTTATKVPTTFYGLGATARVTTTITLTTNWAIGISGQTSAFCSANATLTAGTTCIANQAAPATVGTTNSLTALLITTTVANPGAGALKARVWGWTPVQPSS